MILVDTDPLVTAANRTDAHAASVAALASAKPPRLVPGLVVAEVAYLLARDGGSTVEADFLRSFSTGFLTAVDITATDLGRNAELVELYSDMHLGATDVCSSPWPDGSSRWSGAR